MAECLADPKVTLFVGDGFKFLSENVAKYDVIITDSSDPVGPAETLFQKSYYQLLYDALAPGGNVCNQGEYLWLNLHQTDELIHFARSVFPVCEYASTSVPTYPSGQIGFVVCSKEPGRDVKTPIRAVPSTRYYNEAMHKASFVLPEFARALFEQGKDVRPIFGRQARALECGKVQKILLLGSGFVARPCAEYLTRNPANQLTIGELSSNLSLFS
jgi:spermidine synthase / saccharopine dehydrogenase (NADP+, L-glutamate-forming)